MNANNDAAFAASYALARHLPDMERGFTITTNYGELAITSEEARRHPAIRHEVESLLKFRLHQAEGSAEGAAPDTADNTITTEASEVVVRPDTATREVTLSIHSRGDANPQALGNVALVLPAALACRLGALLLASGTVLEDAAGHEGGTQ